MPDALQEAYEAWQKTVTDPVEFQAFQGGFTAGSVSMRKRALAAIDAAQGSKPNDLRNTIKNAIGALPDIG